LKQPSTKNEKSNGVLVRHTRDGWLIKGILWDSQFARAVAPVEYQLLMSKRLRRIAKRNQNRDEKIRIAYEALLLERSAKRDAECEIKWGARKRNG
jgi:hypothetical protein